MAIHFKPLYHDYTICGEEEWLSDWSSTVDDKHINCVECQQLLSCFEVDIPSKPNSEMVIIPATERDTIGAFLNICANLDKLNRDNLSLQLKEDDHEQYASK